MNESKTGRCLTCNRMDLESLGSWPTMPKNFLHGHCSSCGSQHMCLSGKVVSFAACGSRFNISQIESRDRNVESVNCSHCVVIYDNVIDLWRLSICQLSLTAQQCSRYILPFDVNFTTSSKILCNNFIIALRHFLWLFAESQALLGQGTWHPLHHKPDLVLGWCQYILMSNAKPWCIDFACRQ